MKEYRATLTINVFINAENEDEANTIFQEMDYGFFDNGDELKSDLIDWEITDLGEIDVEDWSLD